jgi:hypothetical protein
LPVTPWTRSLKTALIVDFGLRVVGVTEIT